MPGTELPLVPGFVFLPVLRVVYADFHLKYFLFLSLLYGPLLHVAAGSAICVALSP